MQFSQHLSHNSRRIFTEYFWYILRNQMHSVKAFSGLSQWCLRIWTTVVINFSLWRPRGFAANSVWEGVSLQFTQRGTNICFLTWNMRPLYATNSNNDHALCGDDHDAVLYSSWITEWNVLHCVECIWKIRSYLLT